MPSSIDIPPNAADHAVNTPLGFRRERNWFLSFVMTPFKDVDQRAAEETSPHQSQRRAG